MRAATGAIHNLNVQVPKIKNIFFTSNTDISVTNCPNCTTTSGSECKNLPGCSWCALLKKKLVLNSIIFTGAPQQEFASTILLHAHLADLWEAYDRFKGFNITPFRANAEPLDTAIGVQLIKFALNQRKLV